MTIFGCSHKERFGRTNMLSLLLCMCLASGCAVGPDFVKPETAVPDGWVSAQPGGDEASLTQWWTVFNDPTLTSLIEEAFKSNLDLQIATSRIRQSRASRGMTASGLGPSIDGTGSFSRSQASGGGNARGATTNSYRTGFDASWEIDIFGGVRRDVESADATLLSAIENRHDVLVTLAAEVAKNYVELRTYQQRIVIAKKNLEAQKHSASLTRQRFEGGFVSGLDAANADAQVATTEAAIPVLESSANQTIYTLSVLLNREPGALLEQLSPAGDIPAAPPAVPVGVPSDLLRRRPDIRKAEANMHAATAQIGVATADLFPKVSISGSLGWSAADSGSLFNPLSRFWSLGPSVTWNLFETGKTISNIELQKALTEESVLTYRQTVLTAIQEVENALVASQKEQEHRRCLKAAVEANRKATDIATQLYVEGNTDFLNVISAQQSLFSSEDSLVQSTSTMATELIALYKALGGGWEEQAPAETK